MKNVRDSRANNYETRVDNHMDRDIDDSARHKVRRIKNAN